MNNFEKNNLTMKYIQSTSMQLIHEFLLLYNKYVYFHITSNLVNFTTTIYYVFVLVSIRYLPRAYILYCKIVYVCRHGETSPDDKLCVS